MTGEMLETTGSSERDEARVSEKNALSISIGVLGAVAVLLTAVWVPVPVWVVFIAWASFFVLGGGVAGLARSVAANLAGVAIATVTLLVADSLVLGLVWTAVAVGVGSAVMVQVSRIALLAVTPAVVLGFASTVGTVAATDRAIGYAAIGNPALSAAVAMVLGALFGIASQFVANALASRSSPVPADGSGARGGEVA